MKPSAWKIISAGMAGCVVFVAGWLFFNRPEIAAPPCNPGQPTEPNRRDHPPSPRQDARRNPPSSTADPEQRRHWIASAPGPTDPAANEVSGDWLVPPEELLDILFDPKPPPCDADLNSGKRTIGGHTVSQARVRFTSDDGRVTEMEVTDMGDSPSVQLLTALGFNPLQADKVTDSGFKLTMDDDGRLGNWEFDHEARAGMFQILVAGRFLVEVRLEEVEAEAFRQFFQNGLPISKLEAMGGDTD